jgi:deferrochelatase/peroxidase EfeB
MSDDSDGQGVIRQGACPFVHDGPVASRRALLLGAGLGGVALLSGREALAQGSTVPVTHDHTIARDSLAADHAHDGAPHDFDNDGTREAQPFYGLHQSGVVNPQPAAAVTAAFDVLATDRADLQRLFKELTSRIAFLMKGGEMPARNPLMPPPDTGLLGPDIFPDNLTITVALGASLFDQRYGLADLKPKHLVPMEQFPNDALEADCCHGDLVIQFCSNTAETNLHALRDLVKSTPDLMSIRWKMDGFLPPHTLKKLGKDTVRNLLGFKDGTANINAQDAPLMDELVWVKPSSDEPEWARHGTYQVVRLIRMTVERWDRTPLAEQQTIMGREKMSGAPLGMTHERDVPDFAADKQGKTIPADAHIRLANPRTPETQKNLILRRPYNFSRDRVSKAGQLDMGLKFICFQADLDAGFRAVQQRLNGEPLEEYIKPFGGGYFFVLPGVRDTEDYLGKTLIERRPA